MGLPFLHTSVRTRGSFDMAARPSSPRETDSTPSDERAAAQAEREDLLYHSRDMGMGSGNEQVADEHDTKIHSLQSGTGEQDERDHRSAIFHQSFAIHVLALGVLLISLIVSFASAGWRDWVLASSIIIAVVLLVGRVAIHRWTDLLAAHRVGAITWTLSSAPVFLVCAGRLVHSSQGTGAAGLLARTRWGGASLFVEGGLAALIHMTTAPSPSSSCFVLSAFYVGTVRHSPSHWAN